jgi:lipopolysaccharide export LptBFGC system permease protein LptF
MTLDLSQKKKNIEKKPKGMTLKELKIEIENLEKLFVDTSRLRSEYHRKISWSFSPVFFILLGFPLAVITHRRERSANVVLAIFSAALYYLISLGCEALSVKGLAPAGLMMWTPNMLAGLAALILNYKCVS